MGFTFNANTGFVKRLLPGIVRRHIDDEIARWDIGGKKIPLTQIALLSIERCNRHQAKMKSRNGSGGYKGKDHANVTTESSHPKNKKRKSDEDQSGCQRIKCYNCNEFGHRFGTMENPGCTAKISDETRKYFKEKKKSPQTSKSKDKAKKD